MQLHRYLYLRSLFIPRTQKSFLSFKIWKFLFVINPIFWIFSLWILTGFVSETAMYKIKILSKYKSNMLWSWGIMWKLYLLLFLLLFLLLPNAFWLKIEWKTAWSPAAKVKQIKLSSWLMFVFVFHYQSSSCRARLVCCLLGINYQCLSSDSQTGWYLSSQIFKLWNLEFLRSIP